MRQLLLQAPLAVLPAGGAAAQLPSMTLIIILPGAGAEVGLAGLPEAVAEDAGATGSQTFRHGRQPSFCVFCS